jgi:integrase
MIAPENYIAPTLSNAVDTFLLFKQAEGITPRTLAWYSSCLGHFCAWIEGRWAWPPKLTAIRPLDIAEWLVHEQERGLSSLTVEGSYRALLAFFNWCEYAEDAGFIESPIGHGLHKAVKRPKVDEADMDYVTFEEYIALTAAIDLASWIDYRDWSLIGVMFWCGVRRGELLPMELHDINFRKHEIRIRHSKARRQRSVFLLEDLIAGIRQYLALRPAYEGTSLWVAYDKAHVGIGGPLSETGLRLMLKRRCRAANLRFLNPHLFRHGFAMAYLNHGVDLKAVGDLMGHSSYKTTEKHYAKWIHEPLRKVHQLAADRISAQR